MSKGESAMLKITHRFIRILPTLILTSLLVIGWLTIGHAQPPAVAVAAAEQAAEQQTTALMGLAKRYQHATKADQQALLEQMITVVEQRSHNMATLVKSNPGAVLRLAIPAKVADQLPAAVYSYLESQQTLEGRLEVLYEDHENHSILRHTLITDFNERIPLHFKHHAPKLQSGKQVRVKGIEVVTDDDMSVAMAVESDDSALQVLQLGESTTPSSTSAPPLSNTFGDQKALVLLVNFQDLNEQPTSTTEISALMEDISDFFYENSYGQTTFSSTVHGWFNLPLNSNSTSSEIAAAADAAAMAAGIDLSSYQRLIYLFPRNSALIWDGLGTVGGQPSRCWINGKFQLKVIAHELGHNFGLYHSHSLECGDAVVSENAQVYEYGDIIDVMGNREAGHLNAFQKMRLGWLDYDQSPGVISAETSGSHLIEVKETAGQNAKAIKVLRGVDPTTGAKEWFYVEYRQNIGFDAFLTNYSNVLDGVVIHLANDADPSSSHLLDLTPSSDSVYFDWNDPALGFGLSFTDPLSGVTISPVWGDGQDAMVEVSYGQASCSPAAPQISVTTVQENWAAPGEALFYTVTVTNTNSAACPEAAVELSTALPAMWDAAFDQSSFTLSPGQSATTQLSVTSPTNAVDGFYEVMITATVNGLSSSTTTGYVVSAPVENQTPLAVNDEVIIATKTPVTIAVLANDSDPEGTTLTVVAVTQGAKGSVVINGDNSVTYSPAKPFKTSDSFSYTISDGISTATARVTINLVKSTEVDDSTTTKTPPGKAKK